MKKGIYVLFALLCVQLVMVVLTGMRDYGQDSGKKVEKLLSFRPEEIDRIEIEGNGDGKVVLGKDNSGWRLPQYYSFPADADSVTKLLDTLAGLSPRWPIATTVEAEDRFKVSPENFERHITLFKGAEKIAEIFFGTSPGIRKIHARAGGDSNIYEVRFSLFEADVNPDSWIDRHVLRVEKPAILKVIMPDIKLEKGEHGFVLSDMDDNTTVVKKEVDFVVGKVSDMTIDGVLGTEKPDGFKGEKPDFEYTLVTDIPDRREISFVFSKPEGKDYYILKSSLRPEYFKVLAWKVDSLKDMKPDRLVKKRTGEPSD
jgi:hypothetical protein